MGKSGGSNTVEKADPWSGAQPYLLDIMRQAQSLSRSNPYSYYPGQTLANWNPLLTGAQGMTLDYAGAISPYTSGAVGANEYLNNDMFNNPMLGMNLPMAGASMFQNMAGMPGFEGQFGASPYAMMGALMQDPTNNPYYSMATQGAMSDMVQQFQQSVLPGIRDEAILAGGYGDSRQGIAEGLATQGLLNNMSGIATKMYGEGLDRQLAATNMAGDAAAGGADRMLQAAQGIGDLYGQSSDTMLKALGISPSTLSMGLMPAQLYGQVGQQQMGWEQSLIDDAMARYYGMQSAPWDTLGAYSNMVSGMGGMGGTMSTNTSSNPLLGMLGGGLSGYALGSMMGMPQWLGPLFGGTMQTAAWPLAILGAFAGM